MNVLFIVTSGYPDCNDIFKRIIKGSKTEHTTFIRANDHLTRGAFEFVKAPYAIAESEWAGEAYLADVMQLMDYVIVYGSPESQPTPFLKQKAKFPYDRIYPEIEFNLAEKKSTKRKKPKGAEYAEGD